MTAKSVALPVSNIHHTAARLPRRTTKPFWIVGLVAMIALAVLVGRAVAGGKTSSASIATPGIQLAVGTLNLEGTAQAVDAAQAARLLPLWELLAQLNSSSSAAPEEITAVTEEIKLNMTAAQIGAIDAMPASNFNLGASSGSPTAASTSASTKAASSAALGVPGLSGMGAAPMDGGGPMPSSGSSQSTSSTRSTKTSASVSGPIQQVIALLKAKVQS